MVDYDKVLTVEMTSELTALCWAVVLPAPVFHRAVCWDCCLYEWELLGQSCW